MSILIKGMDMPKGNSTLNVLIYSNGRIFAGHKDDNEYSAVEVPTPHGRLIDADEAIGEIVNGEYIAMVDKYGNNWMMPGKAIEIIANAKTIIEAEESE